MKKIIAAILAATALAIPAKAARVVEIRLDTAPVNMEALLISGTTYVPFDRGNEVLSDGLARISGDTRVMRAESGGKTVISELGNRYTEAMGRYFGSSENLEVDGRLYLPIRALAKAYGTTVEWNSIDGSVDLYREGSELVSGEDFYDDDELYWLSRIINAEAGAEPMTGKILVGNVVLNRVHDGDFPSSIYEVIFDKKYGVQFTPTVNGTVYNTPTEESIIAAKICLDSYYISRAALYFLNPVMSTSLWIPANREYIMTVGCHDFYA